jgi:hypothetical protein
MAQNFPKVLNFREVGGKLIKIEASGLPNKKIKGLEFKPVRKVQRQ